MPCTGWLQDAMLAVCSIITHLHHGAISCLVPLLCAHVSYQGQRSHELRLHSILFYVACSPLHHD